MEVSDLGWGRELAGGAPGRAEDGGGGGGGAGVLRRKGLWIDPIPLTFIYSVEHLHCARCRVGLRCSGVTSSR